MDKFKNKYRIPSARLQSWDYGSNGAYFITICTHNREYFFGEIVDAKFIASELGQLAEKFWLKIPQHFSFVELGNFVVMPNHTHGILIINKKVDVETLKLGVSTGGKNKKWKPQTIGVIVNQYKRMVTIHARKIQPKFAWQSRFHDHIIRNNKSFERLQIYIETNPMNWVEDRFFIE